MIDFVKQAFYYLRLWLSDLTRYPKAIHVGEEEGDSYDEYWAVRGRRGKEGLSGWQKERADIAAAVMKKRGGVQSLGDIGAGSGAVLSYLVSTCAPQKAVAYEISSRALEAIQEEGLRGVRLDIRNKQERENIEPASYVLLFEVLEHTHDPEALLEVAYRKASQGVFFSVPNTGFLTHRLRLFFGKVPLQWQRNPSEHIRFWTVVDMRWWLKTLGYTSFRVYPYRGVPILNQWWPNLFAEGMVVCMLKDHV